MLGLFRRLQEGLIKTTPTFQKAFHSLMGGRKIDASSREALEEALYGADFGVETTAAVLAAIDEAGRKEKLVDGDAAARLGAEVLERLLAKSAGKFVPTRPLEVVALIGVNGAGKTTTAAKLAYRMSQDGYAPLLGACDTFRAAANEQIKAWADRLSLDLVSSQPGADAAAVAFDAYQAAVSRGRRVLLLDTAGRLHTKSNLLEELKKIRRVLQKLDPEAPHHRWLVVDGSQGTNAIEQARVFHAAFNLTGLIVTKLDGTSRGGALVPIHRELGLPIYYVGLGEQPDDLQPFDPRDYARAVFGLGEEDA